MKNDVYLHIYMLIVMQENGNIHRYIVPIGYTLAWCFGIFMGGNFIDLFDNGNVSSYNDPIYLLFNGTISVYIAFLLECVFMFIDWGAIYKDERFNGKIFYLVAGIILHVFVTIWVVGSLMSNMEKSLVCFLLIWIVIFKLGICLISANVRQWLSEIALRVVISNKIK